MFNLPLMRRTRILRQGRAARVVFFYPGEEGSYIDQAEVTLFDNGMVHIHAQSEETTTHLQNCEILWRIETEGEEGPGKVFRLVKPRPEGENLKR